MIREGRKVVMYPFRNNKVIEIITKNKNKEGFYKITENKGFIDSISLLQEITPAVWREDSIQPNKKYLSWYLTENPDTWIKNPEYSLQTLCIYMTNYSDYIKLEESENYDKIFNGYDIDKQNIDVYIESFLKKTIKKLNEFLNKDNYILRFGNFDSNEFFVVLQYKTQKSFDYIEIKFKFNDSKKELDLRQNYYTATYKTTYGGRKLNKGKEISKSDLLDILKSKVQLLIDSFKENSHKSLKEKYLDYNTDTVYLEYVDYLNNSNKFKSIL